jgi:chromosome segregation ATPase
MESSTSKLKVEVATLQEQKSNLEASLNDLRKKAEEDSTLQRQAHTNVVSDYESRFAQQEANLGRITQAEERRAARAEKELEDAKVELNDLKRDLREAKKAEVVLEDKLAAVHAELDAVKKRAMEDAQPSLAQVEENNRMSQRIRELETLNEGLVERAKRINDRHKEGDLVRFVFFPSFWSC